MSAKVKAPAFCGACAYGRHQDCKHDDCACAEHAHEPDRTLAARMFAYCRPDLSRLPESERAHAWNQAVGR